MLFSTGSKRLQKIPFFFPVRGHRNYPCDRDFCLIKKVIRRIDRIFSTHEITELIIKVKSGKARKFLVSQAQGSNILDLAVVASFYKKTTLSEETKITFYFAAQPGQVMPPEKEG